MQNKRIREFLDNEKIKYDIITHAPAYTAQEIAANAHISGRDLAKIVMIKIDGKLAMLVLPATQKVNIAALKKWAKADEIELASEYEFQDKFPDCELGAMPAFCNLYEKMDVFVDDCLLKEDEIAFNAGNHTELIKMKYKDWAKLVKPRVVRIH